MMDVNIDIHSSKQRGFAGRHHTTVTSIERRTEEHPRQNERRSLILQRGIMMLICSECLMDYKLSKPMFLTSRSKSLCEDCNRIRTCFNIPASVYSYKDLRDVKILERKRKKSFNPSER